MNKNEITTKSISKNEIGNAAKVPFDEVKSFRE